MWVKSDGTTEHIPEAWHLSSVQSLLPLPPWEGFLVSFPSTFYTPGSCLLPPPPPPCLPYPCPDCFSSPDLDLSEGVRRVEVNLWHLGERPNSGGRSPYPAPTSVANSTTPSVDQLDKASSSPLLIQIPSPCWHKG